MPIGRGKSSRPSATRRPRPSRHFCFEGLEAAQAYLDRCARGRAERAHRRDHEVRGRRHVRRGAHLRCSRSPSSPSATTATAPAPSISTVAFEPNPTAWTPPRTARLDRPRGRRAVDARQVPPARPRHWSAPPRASAPARSPCAAPGGRALPHPPDHPDAAGPGHPGRRPDRRRVRGHPPPRGKPGSAGSSASSVYQEARARPSSTTRVRSPWSAGPPTTASCGGSREHRRRPSRSARSIP